MISRIRNVHLITKTEHKYGFFVPYSKIEVSCHGYLCSIVFEKRMTIVVAMILKHRCWLEEEFNRGQQVSTEIVCMETNVFTEKIMVSFVR